MQTDNLVLWCTAVGGLLAALAAIFKDWRKPSVDRVTGAKLRTEVNKAVDEREVRLGQRAARMEDYVFEEVRPWGRALIIRDEFVLALLVKAYEKLEMPMPEIPPLLPMPEMPPPLPELT